MWEGMFMCVKNLENSTHELRNLHPRRVTRIKDTIHTMCFELFGMSMAVDEYILWLGQRDYFPPNFSVRHLLGTQRYDQINKVFAEIKDGNERAD